MSASKKGGCLKIGLMLLAIGLLVFILLIGGGIFALNSWVRSDEFKEAVRAQISEKVGTEVKYQEASLDPLKGIVIEGLAIANSPKYSEADFLSIGKITVKYSLWSILSGKGVIIDSIEVNHPVLNIYQKEDGSMDLPFASQEAPPKENLEETKPVGVKIPEIYLRSGDIFVTASSGSHLVNVGDLFIESSYELPSDAVDLGSSKAQGKISIERLKVIPGLEFTDVGCNLLTENEILQLSDLKGSSYSGAFEGNGKINFDGASPNFDFALKGEGIVIEEMLKSFEQKPETFEGQLQLDLGVKGKLAEPKDLTGSGTFRIVPAKLGKLKRLHFLGQILGVDALREGKFDMIRGNLTLGERKLRLKDLVAQSQDVNFTVTGWVSFENTLDLHGELVLAPQNAEKLMSILSTIMGLQVSLSDDGKYHLPLTLKGKTSDPLITVAGWSIPLDMSIEEILKMNEGNILNLLKKGLSDDEEGEEDVDSILKKGIKSLF
ncbi:MAG: AsmA-like C-terminal region-containing protein [Verrucomicrobiota bacterium]